MKKILILILFFYILVLWQTSFLIHFNILGITPNLALILVVLINLFEKPEDFSGIFSAFAGGFFLDIFSSSPIGFYTLILLALAIFIKMILRKYVWVPFR